MSWPCLPADKDSRPAMFASRSAAASMNPPTLVKTLADPSTASSLSIFVRPVANVNSLLGFVQMNREWKRLLSGHVVIQGKDVSPLLHEVVVDSEWVVLFVSVYRHFNKIVGWVKAQHKRSVLKKATVSRVTMLICMHNSNELTAN